jgi:hypothetical protein
MIVPPVEIVNPLQQMTQDYHGPQGFFHAKSGSAARGRQSFELVENGAYMRHFADSSS